MTETVWGVVLNFRTPEKTLRCIESLLASAVYHCVLVDNSEDGGHSLRAMEEGLAHLRASGLDLRVVAPGRNLGFAAGVNRALALIQDAGPGDVLLINSDAVLVSGGLEGLKRSLGEDGGLAAPMHVTADGARHMPRAYYNRWIGSLHSRRGLGGIEFVSGACLLISKEVAGSTRLDERLFFYGEDVYLCWHVRRGGGKIQVARDASVLHEGSGSSRNGSLFYEYHINRSHLLMPSLLAGGTLQKVMQMMGRIAYLPARAVWRSLRFRSTLPLKGLLMAASDRCQRRLRPLTPPWRHDASDSGMT